MVAPVPHLVGPFRPACELLISGRAGGSVEDMDAPARRLFEVAGAHSLQQIAEAARPRTRDVLLESLSLVEVEQFQAARHGAADDADSGALDRVPAAYFG